MTVEPSTAGHNWPDDAEIGDGALQQVQHLWPYLSRELRLAIVAIAKLGDAPLMQVDGDTKLSDDENGDIPF